MVAVRTDEELKRSGEGLAAIVSEHLRQTPDHNVRRLKAVDNGIVYRLELWFAHGTDPEAQRQVVSDMNIAVYVESARRPWRLRLCPVTIIAKEMPE